tara:strand:+ start:432 stop:878 length:447 start_codon:yes stop_codon:yes gene_type:complete
MQIWSSIDELPVFYYFKVIEKGDLKYLIETDSKSTPEETKLNQLIKAWDNIQTELIELNMKDPKYMADLQGQKRHYLRKIKATLSQKTVDQIHYERYKPQYENEDKFDYDKSLAILEKHLGFSINDKQMTVKRYYTHLQLMKEQSKAA